MFCVLLFTRILVLDFSFYRACFQALRKLSMALDCRREEKIQAVKSDIEVSKQLKHFYSSAPIEMYYSRGDVIRRHPEFKENKA